MKISKFNSRLGPKTETFPLLIISRTQRRTIEEQEKDERK